MPVRLRERNRFPVPTADLVFAGLRGAVMKTPLANDFTTAGALDAAAVDYRPAVFAALNLPG